MGVSSDATSSDLRLELLATVLLALATLGTAWAAYQARARTSTARIALLALGWALFLGTAIWMATFPTHVTI